jgi:hypothetical protein
MKLFGKLFNWLKAIRSAAFSPLQCRLLRVAGKFATASGARELKRTKVRAPFGELTVVLLVSISALTGCESTDGGSAHVSGSAYYGAGFYDPWYYGGDYDDADIVVTPPDRPDRPDRPVRPEQPIARPPASTPRPTPMPSIPSTPRPMPRGGGGRR